MHTLEGALRSQSRREGRFLTCRIVVPRDPASPQTYQFNCVLNQARCTFVVRLEALDLENVGQETWRCVEIRSQHSCVSTASPVNEKLKWRMDWWVRA